MPKYLLFAVAVSFISASAYSQPNLSPLPDSLKVGNELVDTKNGFAITIDQPGVKWQMEADTDEGTQYIGIDEVKHTVYIVDIDKHRFSELKPQSAKVFVQGVKSSLSASGWTVGKTSYAPNKIPREHSYRVANALMNAGGGQAQYVGFVTSPNKLYAIESVAAKVDEKALQALATSFRLLH